MSETTKLDNYYASLGTVPGLIGDMAQGIAVAQARLDRNYINSLTKFLAIVEKALETGAVAGLAADATPEDKKAAKDAAAKRFTELFQAIAPSRYQFTETILEVRADLQSSSSSSLGVDAGIGLNAGPVAVTVNASYTRRNSYDFRAAALIRTTLHAISANESVMKELLARLEKETGAELPEFHEGDALGEAVTNLIKADAEQPETTT